MWPPFESECTCVSKIVVETKLDAFGDLFFDSGLKAPVAATGKAPSGSRAELA